MTPKVAKGVEDAYKAVNPSKEFRNVWTSPYTLENKDIDFSIGVI